MAEAWQIKTGEWPDHTQTVKMTNTVMKKYPGLKREDLIKGLERGTAGGGGLDSKDLQKSYGDVISLAARLSGNSGIQIGQGEGGIPEISIGSVKDPVKLAEMMQTIVESQSYLPKTVQEAVRKTIVALRGAKPAPAVSAQPAPSVAQPAPTGKSAVPPTGQVALPAAPNSPDAIKQRLRERYGLTNPTTPRP